jgi:hypothetical protein
LVVWIQIKYRKNGMRKARTGTANTVCKAKNSKSARDSAAQGRVQLHCTKYSIKVKGQGRDEQRIRIGKRHGYQEDMQSGAR